MTEFVYRREEAVNKMLEVIELINRIKTLREEIGQRVTVSEIKYPSRVEGLAMDKIKGKIAPSIYGGHQLIYGDFDVLLHTGGDSQHIGNNVFEHVLKQFQEKLENFND